MYFLIHKKGDKQSLGNYWPVSITSVPSKVLESMVRDWLLQHLTDHELLHSAQYKFLLKQWCTSQLLEVLDDWNTAIEDGQPVDVCYLDFAKAFDLVPHGLLLRKLKAYGITGNPLTWIESFLSGSLRRVLVQEGSSDWCLVTSGILQGSVLGPTLFIIYMNDLPECVTDCVRMFADDTKMYCEGRSRSLCQLCSRMSIPSFVGRKVAHPLQCKQM